MSGGGAEIDGGVRSSSRAISATSAASRTRRWRPCTRCTRCTPTARTRRRRRRPAFDLVDRLERELSRFLPNSDITRINHLDAGGSTRVAPSTLECLVIARHMFDLTGGAFDVSIGTGLPSLEFDTDESIVRATTRGVRVDLGGIGKGYAVDLMAELLEDWGLTAALVHGGFSSVLALEPPPER